MKRQGLSLTILGTTVSVAIARIASPGVIARVLTDRVNADMSVPLRAEVCEIGIKLLGPGASEVVLEITGRGFRTDEEYDAYGEGRACIRPPAGWSGATFRATARNARAFSHGIKDAFNEYEGGPRHDA